MKLGFKKFYNNIEFWESLPLTFRKGLWKNLRFTLICVFSFNNIYGNVNSSLYNTHITVKSPMDLFVITDVTTSLKHEKFLTMMIEQNGKSSVLRRRNTKSLPWNRNYIHLTSISHGNWKFHDIFPDGILFTGISISLISTSYLCYFFGSRIQGR